MSGVSNGADPWFQAMVGQWWTPPSDLSLVGAAATKRRATSAAWQRFSDQLRQELSGSLSPELQKGMGSGFRFVRPSLGALIKLAMSRKRTASSATLTILLISVFMI